MPVITVATIIPKPEHRAEVIAAFEEAIAAVHTEDGCEFYALHEGEDRLVVIEKWSSMDAATVHSTAPALAKLGPSLAGKLAAPLDVQHLTPHPAGTAEQGTL